MLHYFIRAIFLKIDNTFYFIRIFGFTSSCFRAQRHTLASWPTSWHENDWQKVKRSTKTIKTKKMPRRFQNGTKTKSWSEYGGTKYLNWRFLPFLWSDLLHRRIMLQKKNSFYWGPFIFSSNVLVTVFFLFFFCQKQQHVKLTNSPEKQLSSNSIRHWCSLPMKMVNRIYHNWFFLANVSDWRQKNKCVQPLKQKPKHATARSDRRHLTADESMREIEQFSL